MKMLKSIMLGVAMVAVFGAANAAKLSNDGPLSTDEVLKTYIAATTQGNPAGYDKILSDDVSFKTILDNDRVIKADKKSMIASAKANEGIKMDCTTSTKLVTQTLENTVYELTVKYADYSVVNTITMVGTDEKGWKITDVKTVNK